MMSLALIVCENFAFLPLHLHCFSEKENVCNFRVIKNVFRQAQKIEISERHRRQNEEENKLKQPETESLLF